MLTKRRYWSFLWNTLIIASASFVAIFTPLSVIFKNWDDTIYENISLGVMLLFLIDILVSIYRNSRLTTFLDDEPPLRAYLRKWLIYDILAVLPFPLFYFYSHSQWELLTIFKLVRVANIMYQLRHKEVRYAYILNIVFFFFWIIHTAHWVACGWLQIGGIAEIFDDTTRYIKSLYWAVTTLTTVGFGDITPQNNLQMIYAIFTELLGIGLYGTLIGNVASLLSKSDPAHTQYLQNIERLSALINYRDVPKDLQERIRDFYTYIWKKRLGYDEKDFLSGLPSSLKTEVIMHLKKEIVEKIPLFQGAEKDFIAEIAVNLQPVIFMPGDYVFKAGDIGREMFFIVKGEVLVLNAEEDRLITKLTEGNFFGEVALYKNTRRNATIRSVSFCDFYALAKDQFDRILTNYPHIAEQIAEKALVREG